VTVCYEMERDAGAASGLRLRSIHDYDYDSHFKSWRRRPTRVAHSSKRCCANTARRRPSNVYGNIPVNLYIGIAMALTNAAGVVHRGGDDLLAVGGDPAKAKGSMGDRASPRSDKDSGSRGSVASACANGRIEDLGDLEAGGSSRRKDHPPRA